MRYVSVFLLSIFAFGWIDTPLALASQNLLLWKNVCASYSWVALPILHLSISLTLFVSSRLIDRFHAFSMPLFQYCMSIGFVMFICGILKLTIARARPHLLIEDGISGFGLGDYGNSFRSFPSSHTAVAVAIAFLIVLNFGSKIKPLVWLFVVFIALSRIILLKHFLSDILIGALIGQVVASSVVVLSKKYQPFINKVFEVIL